MITIDINANGYANGDAWSRVVCDPAVPDTCRIHTTYPQKYTRDRYRMQYIFRDSDFTTQRIDLDGDGNVYIPMGFVDANNRIFCKFIITLASEGIDVLTSTFELILTLEACSYLNPDADKMIVVSTRKAMYRLPSDSLANGKVIKVVYDDTNNQQSVFYYWDAVAHRFSRENALNAQGHPGHHPCGPAENSEAKIVYSEEEMLHLRVGPGALVYRHDLDSLFILAERPAASLSNWTVVGFDIFSLPHSNTVEDIDYILIGDVSDETQRRITIGELGEALLHWKPFVDIVNPDDGSSEDPSDGDDSGCHCPCAKKDASK